MKLLLLTEYFPTSAKGDISGGVEARIFYLSKELAKKHSVTVICSWKNGEERKQVINRVNVIRVGPNHPYTNKGNILSRLKFSKAAYQEAIKHSADIVEGTNFITYIPAYKAARKIGAKAVATYHEVWAGEWIKNKGLITGLLGEIWERKVLKLNWDKFIAVSEFTKNKLIKFGIDSKKISVVYNGIDLSHFKKFKDKKYPEPTIVCQSRLVSTKRVDDLIRALPLVRNKIPKVKCIIVGVGQELENLMKLAKELKVDDMTAFVGRFEKHDDLIRTFRKSWVLALPSVVEGFGMVLVEAAAVGTPYVCSDIEVLKEVNSKVKYGFTFKQKDHMDLANKIISALNHKFNKAKVENFDWTNLSKHILQD